MCAGGGFAICRQNSKNYIDLFNVIVVLVNLFDATLIILVAMVAVVLKQANDYCFARRSAL